MGARRRNERGEGGGERMRVAGSGCAHVQSARAHTHAHTSRRTNGRFKSAPLLQLFFHNLSHTAFLHHQPPPHTALNFNSNLPFLICFSHSSFPTPRTFFFYSTSPPSSPCRRFIYYQITLSHSQLPIYDRKARSHFRFDHQMFPCSLFSAHVTNSRPAHTFVLFMPA